MIVTVTESVRTFSNPSLPLRIDVSQSPGYASFGRGIMTKPDSATIQPIESILPPRRLWSRDEFERAGELGFFGPEERLELIGGEVVCKIAPQKTPHATSIRLVEEALRRVAGPGFDVRVELPLALGTHSEPEPDIAVVVGTPRDYEVEHPTTAALVVEVSDTTLTFDRNIKASLYAGAGVPECWIINLRDHALEVLRQPAPMADQPFGHHYRSVTRHTESDLVSSLLGQDKSVKVIDLLPRRRSA
jgi:Uma2 family endonuclease